MFPMGVIDRNGEGPLPDDFLDLPKGGRHAEGAWNAGKADL